MNGQMLSCKEKEKLIEEYIEKINPYQPLVPLKFDLRKYSAYVSENNLKEQNITEDILKKFVL